MTEERFDKLLKVMLEFREDFNQFKAEMYEFRKEVNERFDRLDSNIDLLALKSWNNEKDIDHIKKTMRLR